MIKTPQQQQQQQQQQQPPKYKAQPYKTNHQQQHKFQNHQNHQNHQTHQTHQNHQQHQKPDYFKHVNHNKISQMKFLQTITNDFPDFQPTTSIIPKFSETNKNVGIIFWYLEQDEHEQEEHEQENSITRQIEILAGVETSYLTDKMVPEIKSILEKYQLYTQNPQSPNKLNNQKEIHEIFEKRAKLLSKELKIPVYFDKPIANSTTKNNKQWQVQYRVLNEIPKLGILKGSMEEYETKEEAVKREIQEELFPYSNEIPMDEEKIIPLPNTIHLHKDCLYTFHYQLNKQEKETIERNIEKLQEENYGELVKYQFRNLNEIFTSPTSTHPNYHLLKQLFNGKSRLYIKEFYDYLYTEYTQ